MTTRAQALRRPRYNIIDTLDPLREVIADHAAVADVHELGAVFGELAGIAPGERVTLDLIGHSSERHGCLLMLGNTAIDGDDGRVIQIFATHAATIRAHCDQLRLVGCNTAAHPRGRTTLSKLTAVLAIPVKGAIQPISVGHFERGGLRAKYDNRFVVGEWQPPW